MAKQRPQIAAAAALLTVLASAGIAEEQTLFTWVDADGTVHYSDKPEHPGAKEMEMASRRTDEARVANEVATREAQQTARQQAAAEAQQASAEQAREQEQRRYRCDQARSRLRTLSVARRPFRVDENGQQIYLNDGQIAAEQAQAQAAVDQWCSGTP
ncbi:MAG: DUF4124 domain-containing protein [Pseudomonadota bacterium]